MDALQRRSIPGIGHICPAIMEGGAGHDDGIQRRKMAKCENNLFGANTPSMRQVDLVNIVGQVTPDSHCFALNLLKRRFAVSFSLLPQRNSR